MRLSSPSKFTSICLLVEAVAASADAGVADDCSFAGVALELVLVVGLGWTLDARLSLFFLPFPRAVLEDAWDALPWGAMVLGEYGGRGSILQQSGRTNPPYSRAHSKKRCPLMEPSFLPTISSY